MKVETQIITQGWFQQIFCNVDNFYQLIFKKMILFKKIQLRQLPFFISKMIPIFTVCLLLFITYSCAKFLRRYFAKPQFESKTVWITGASSGIGESLAYEFNKLKANIIISSRNLKELSRVRSNCKYPENVQIVQLDMTNFQEIESVTADLLNQLKSRNQKLDIVVQNAGISMRCLFKQYHFKNHLFMSDLNIHGPFKHIQCFVNHMIENKSGHIVAITSLSGKISTSYRSSYSGTKSGLIGILDSIRSELESYGITVTNIMPGYVKTNLSKNALVSGEKESLGFTDKNIENGISAQKFAEQSVKAIYNKQQQLQISGIFLVPIMLAVRNMCPDLSFLYLKYNKKNQSQALKKK